MADSLCDLGWFVWCSSLELSVTLMSVTVASIYYVPFTNFHQRDEQPAPYDPNDNIMITLTRSEYVLANSIGNSIWHDDDSGVQQISYNPWYFCCGANNQPALPRFSFYKWMMSKQWARHWGWNYLATIQYIRSPMRSVCGKCPWNQFICGQSSW